MPQRSFLVLAALNAFLAVAAGAFGAHGLKAVFSDYQMGIYRTAVDYQMWHALGLGLIAVVAGNRPGARDLMRAGGFMQAGILLFSGSLYALAFTGIRALGFITPFGGVCLLTAWLLLGLAAWRTPGRQCD